MTERTLHYLARLVGFATVTDGPNLAVTEYLQATLAEFGFDVHRISDQSGERAGLFASLGPAGAGGVLLSAHTDVVPVTGQNWSSDPFKLRRDGGQVYGRGTTDMLGFVACMLSAAEQAATKPPARPLKIALSWDEEIGCAGIREMIGHLEPSIGLPDYCIVGEPTLMRVATGHKGKAALRAVCTGTGGHSAHAPEFLNALHLATDFVAALRSLQDDLATNGKKETGYQPPYSTIHVGKMTGGVALNIVPDKAVIDFEVRHLAADDPQMLLSRIQKAAANVAGRYKSKFPTANIQINERNAYPGLDTPASADVVRTATGLAGTETTKVAYGTEAGYFSDHLKIPTVVCGPGNMDQGHKPDEFIEISQLEACDAMLTRLLDSLR